MYTYQREDYALCAPEIDALLPAHFDEVAMDQDAIPLAKNETEYQRIAASGQLHIITCRCDGKLIGYIAGFVRPGLHNATSLMCYTDVYYIEPTHRRGRVGMQLFQHYEQSLKQRGVKKLYSATKVHLDMSKLFEHLGWTKSEIVFTKVI